ncbi:TPA: helix-turn-helix domain-containing protein [Bacillus tropicus]
MEEDKPHSNRQVSSKNIYLSLKAILDKRGMSIRQLSDKSGLPFETLRRLYNDQTKQYQ